MKTIKISLVVLFTVLFCNTVFAESGYLQNVRAQSKAGQAWAQKAMGDVFYFGIDMKANHKKAFEWYRKAAEQGEPSAMSAIGKLYYFGEGVANENEKARYKKAAAWYRRAADAGDPESLYSLARMYQYGIGVNQDVNQAEKLYQKSIKEHLHRDSLYPLARLYLDNPELGASSEEILAWVILAQNAGNTSAENILVENAGKSATEHAIDYHELLDDLSPAQRKHVWEKAYNDFHVDWNVVTKTEVSGAGKKMAVAKTLTETLSPEELFNRVWQSVVYIETETASGSGVIVQPDIIATNCHVVDDAKVIRVYQSKERSARENIPYIARHPVSASGRDYCLLHVPLFPGSGIPATIRHYDTLNIGETVYALGAPEGEKLSLSKGIISQLRDEASYSSGYAPARYIQSDVDIAHGSSGGGLFDSAGNLIGHTTAGSAEEGLKFSIPADIILDF